MQCMGAEYCDERVCQFVCPLAFRKLHRHHHRQHYSIVYV